MGPFWDPIGDRGVPGGFLEGPLAPPWGFLGARRRVSGRPWGGVWSFWGLLSTALGCAWAVLKSLKIQWFL